MPAGWLFGTDYAHRGLWGPGVPENSPAAFAAAVQAGLGGELDVRLSADGIAMVFHDRLLAHLTGQPGAMSAHTAHDLTGLPLLGSDQTIARLDRVLADIAGQVPVLIELKPGSLGLAHAVAQVLTDYRGPVAVMSFQDRLIDWFARTVPHRVRGLVLTTARAHQTMWPIRRMASRPHFLAIQTRGLPCRLASRARRDGAAILSWTVRSEAEAARLAPLTDGLIREGEGLRR